MPLEPLELAAEIHALWCHWMKHLFTRAGYEGKGLIVLSAEDSARWWRQAYMDFADLPAHEQESDCALARQLLEKWHDQVN